MGSDAQRLRIAITNALIILRNTDPMADAIKAVVGCERAKEILRKALGESHE